MDNCGKSFVQMRFTKPNTIAQYIIQRDYDVFAHKYVNKNYARIQGTLIL